MRISVRGKQFVVGSILEEEVERRIYLALGRFADVIRNVHMSLADVNGLRGEIDKSARIVVLLKPAGEVVVEATDVTLLVAIDRTCYRVKRLVSRAVERRNQLPSTTSLHFSKSSVHE